jgi:site-specific DNA recombinase
MVQAARSLPESVRISGVLCWNEMRIVQAGCSSYCNRCSRRRALPARYDDGGYSGGNLDRPALKCLLDDVQADKVDTIVVYKVDCFTRSLADFAKIVEALDARGVSFVSVTQQFNTTTSMGRLTLNILLSFAQFEREVTGERIRDKIAASKRKGMWMGGTVPLGYDVKDRKLVVNPEDAKMVVRLFNLYLELGCVSKLKARLDQEGIKSKARTSAAGNRSGGTSYCRGALYQILKNRIYLGEIPHRGQNHPGEHAAIVPRELWEPVQAQLKSDHQGRRNGLKANSPSLLVWLLQDAEGNRFTPSHTSKDGRRYRYYVCQTTSDGSETANRSSSARPTMLNGRLSSGCNPSYSPAGRSWMRSVCQRNLWHGRSRFWSEPQNNSIS